MPQTLITKFQYTTNIPYSSYPTPQIYVFRGNGPYDPDASGTGTQPIGFDAMTTFYGYYEVYASKIEVTLINEMTSSLTMAIVPAITTTDAVDFLTTKAMPLGKTIICGPKGSGSENKTLINYCRTFDVFGLKAGTDTDIGAAMTSNPTRQWYWPVVLESADQSSTITCNVLVVITYYVILSNRKVNLNS